MIDDARHVRAARGMVLRSATVLVLVGLLGACAADLETDSEPAPVGAVGTVATFDGGEVTTAEADALVRVLPQTERAGDVEALVEVYRRIARDRAIEEILLDQLGGATALPDLLGDEWAALEDQVRLDAWLITRLGGNLEVSEQEIQDFWEENLDGFNPPPQRFVAMIFKRADAGIEAARAAVAAAKARVDAGEAFEAVAREVSDSETRAIGGRVGWMPSGRLPPQVEAEIFPLSIGDVSDPVDVRGGAAIFYIIGRRDARESSLDEHRLAIARRLIFERRLEQLDELSADLEPPEGSVVLPIDEVAQAFVEDPDRVVLAIGEDTLDAKTLDEQIRQFEAEQQDLVPPLRRERQDILEKLFAEHQAIGLLALEVAKEAPSAEAAENLQAEVRRLASLIAARRELDERMASAFDDAEVESFHRDNAFSYTTPVELRVQMLVAPLGEVPERSLRRLEELASEIDAGTTDLQAVAREMNGRVESLGWLDAANLGDVPAKVRLYVQDLPRTGPTVPFRLGESLMLVEVLERREPRPLPFEEVEDQVRVDFIARHHQQLYEKVAEEVLSTAAFAFHPEVVTEHLRAGAPAEEPGGGADPEPQSGSTRGDDPEPAAV